ncbi:MAG: hypothetical protein JWO67_7190 [Streptosporangiaceae bacterium]|nr:hypothetical protein [Streptosporangiaceae bacterium]
MPTDLPVFPDVEQVLMDLFADLAATVVTFLPADLQQRLPLVRVRRLGGGDDKWTDQPRVDVEVYAADRAAGMPLAKLLQQRLISRPNRTAHGVIDRAGTEVGPREVPYDDPDTRLFTATYRVSLRRR